MSTGALHNKSQQKSGQSLPLRGPWAQLKRTQAKVV